MGRRQKLIAFVLVLGIAAMACAPLDLAIEIAGLIATASVTATPTQTSTPTATPDLETLDWYVSPGGNNSNSCMTPEDACQHLAVALRKASPSDHIHMSAGSFNATGSDFALVAFNVTISGEGPGVTILNGGGTVGGIRVYGSAELDLQNLTIRETDVRSANGCLHVADTATARLTNVRLRLCQRQAAYVAPGAFLFMTDVEIHESVDENTDPDFVLNGWGLYNAGTTHMEGGSIHHNEFQGIRNSGNLNASNVDIYENATAGIEIVDGTVVFNSVTIHHNGSRSPRAAVSIRNTGVAMIYDSEIYNNNEIGITVNTGGELLLVRSTIRDHIRQALAVRESSTAEVEASTIRNSNTAGGWGFAIINHGELILSATDVIDTNGLGIYAIGNARTEIYDSEIVDQNERAIYNQDATGVLIMQRVLVANSLSGVTSYGDLTMANVTISNSDGTGLVIGGTANVSYVTVTGNDVGYSGGSGSTQTFANVLIANNGFADCTSPLALYGSVSGLNIDTDGTCEVATHTNAELALGALADNGGFSRTHALGAGSVAIDTATGSCPASDQRGLAYARPAGSACDVGAFEAGATAAAPAPIVISSETPTITATLQSFDQITVILTGNARCRTGPSAAYQDHDFFSEGDQSVITGRNTDASWLVIAALNNGGTCWIGRNVLDVEGATEVLMSLPVITPPPTPTPSPLPTNTPTAQGTAPAAPQQVSYDGQVCNAQEYTVSFSWTDAANNEQGYIILRDGVEIANLPANSTKYTDSPPYGGPYTYTIRAYNQFGTAQQTVQDPGCIY